MQVSHWKGKFNPRGPLSATYWAGCRVGTSEHR